MIDKVHAWRTADGTLYEKQDDAKTHDFVIALKAWFAESFPSKSRGPKPYGPVCERMVKDRMQLLAIFKTLNGAPEVVAPDKVVTLHGER